MIGDQRVKLGEPLVGEKLSNLISLFSNWSETPSLDAQVLLAHICGRNRAWILAHPEAEITSEEQQALAAAVADLEAGVPLPYFLGQWSFYGLEFALNQHVLIPRPETEMLVELGLNWLQKYPRRLMVADIGTGSGCIAIALAVNKPDIKITATDVSSCAIEVARSNAIKHAVTNQIDFIQTDLFPPTTIQPPFHLICANLPYIPTDTLVGLDVFNREPALALDGGSDGLDLIRGLLAQAQHNLSSGGLLLIEIEASQGRAGLDLAQGIFPQARIDLLCDLAGHDRVIRIETFAE